MLIVSYPGGAELSLVTAIIVTNAKADQVCVMESDNKHGWISTTGYPGEKRIKVDHPKKDDFNRFDNLM